MNIALVIKRTVLPLKATNLSLLPPAATETRTSAVDGVSLLPFPSIHCRRMSSNHDNEH